MPATMIPPSAAGTPPCDFAAITGAMNAKLEPVYDGTRFFVSRLKTIVPMPEKKIVVLTGKPVSTGTSAVAPNIARMCCPPRPSMFGMFSRSSGRTTAPGSTVRPSPWIFQTLPRPDPISPPSFALRHQPLLLHLAHLVARQLVDEPHHARALCGVSRSATWPANSSWDGDSPSRKTTHATIRSPRSGSGSPVTAASTTPGCSSSAPSISPAPILNPPLLIRSVARRPTIRM